MQLYLKQKVFAIRDKYNILDFEQNLVYAVSGELFTFIPKFHLCDENGKELFCIKKRFFLFLAKYDIFEEDALIATIKQDMAFFRKRMTVESLYGNFSIKGDVFAWDFSIISGGKLCASVSKKLLSWGDSYEISIYDDENAAFICAMVIAIDNCLHNGN